MEIREEKAAIIGIFIKDFDAVPRVNGILHWQNRYSLPCQGSACHFHHPKYHS